MESATASVEPRLGVERPAHAHHCAGVEHPEYVDEWPMDQERRMAVRQWAAGDDQDARAYPASSYRYGVVFLLW